MHETNTMRIHKSTLYASAWLIYILFTVLAFPIFSITVFLFSIALSTVGAWLYRYPGWQLTTLLTIPYHYVLLTYSSDDPAIWNEAFNPFGITTQLFISGAIALLKSAKDKLDHLNSLLEQKIEKRTQELNRLRHYIIENHETIQILLSQMLIEDIGTPLSDMLKESEILVTHLIAEGSSESVKAARLNSLIHESINLIKNLEFIDSFVGNEHVQFSCSVRKLADNFQETAGTHFELDLGREHEQMPKPLQYQLYRITHEAVTNAVRHAKADLVQISLRLKDNSYHLTVINSGQSMPEHPTMGLGLKLMQHRALQIDGTISFDATPDGLTRFRFVMPQPLIKPE